MALDHHLFAMIHANLQARAGRPAAGDYPNLTRLAELPWLDQPQVVEPVALKREVYSAWNELWTLQLSELVLGPHAEQTPFCGWRGALRYSTTFGSCFATALHQLTSFVAAARPPCRLNVATHRALVIGSRVSELRLLRGGRAQSRASIQGRWYLTWQRST